MPVTVPCARVQTECDRERTCGNRTIVPCRAQCGHCIGVLHGIAAMPDRKQFSCNFTRATIPPTGTHARSTIRPSSPRPCGGERKVVTPARLRTKHEVRRCQCGMPPCTTASQEIQSCPAFSRPTVASSQSSQYIRAFDAHNEPACKSNDRNDGTFNSTNKTKQHTRLLSVHVGPSSLFECTFRGISATSIKCRKSTRLSAHASRNFCTRCQKSIRLNVKQTLTLTYVYGFWIWRCAPNTLRPTSSHKGAVNLRVRAAIITNAAAVSGTVVVIRHVDCHLSRSVAVPHCNYLSATKPWLWRPAVDAHIE